MSKLPIYIIFTITFNSLFGNISPWVISYPQGDYTSINKDSFNIDLISKPILACYKPDGISDSFLKILNLPQKDIFKLNKLVFCGIDSFGNCVIICNTGVKYTAVVYANAENGWVQVDSLCDSFLLGMLNYMNQFTSFGYTPIIEFSKLEFTDIARIDKKAIFTYKTLENRMGLPKFEEIVKKQLLQR